MNAPAILICPECLHSVETGSIDGADGWGLCPHCGANLGPMHAAEGSELALSSPIDLTPDDFPWETREGSAPIVAETVGRFQLRELLGGGGYGQVFRAYDPRLDREVALKVLKESNPSARTMERFFREARIAAQLDHPSIIALHDAGRDDGRCWIAYQYVEGPTLASLMTAQRLTPRRAAEIAHALADALHHAHSRGVFHRDLKPSNILVDTTGRPRLTDFGLALRDGADPTLTHDGAVLGTPAYMSPEQAAGFAHAVDARSDIYSLGIIVYEMLCGQRPCDLPSSLPAWRINPYMETVTPRKLRHGVPRRLDQICRRALATDLSRRFANAADMRDALQACLRPRLSPGLTLLLAALALLPLATLARPTAPAARPVTQNPPQHVIPSPQPAQTLIARPSFIGNLRRHTYHAPACQTLLRLEEQDCTPFDSAEEAAASGYRACTLCLPGSLNAVE